MHDSSAPQLSVSEAPTGSSSTSETPSTFPLFPFLPLELRLQIWSLVPPPSRLVTIRLNDNPLPEHPHYDLLPSAIPPLLHACAESRSSALATQTLTFTSIARSSVYPYFSPSHDTLCLDSLHANWASETMSPESYPLDFGISAAELSAVESVVVKQECAYYSRDGIKAQVQGMTALRKVDFVYEDLKRCFGYWLGIELIRIRADLGSVLENEAASYEELELGVVWSQDVEDWQNGECAVDKKRRERGYGAEMELGADGEM